MQYFKQQSLKTRLLKGALAFCGVLLFVAQIPQDVPKQTDDKVEVTTSTEDFILYILIPVVLILFYIVFRKRISLNPRRKKENPE